MLLLPPTATAFTEQALAPPRRCCCLPCLTWLTSPIPPSGDRICTCTSVAGTVVLRSYLHLHLAGQVFAGCHRKTPSELCIQSKARYDLNTQRKCKYEIRRPHEHPSRPSPTLVKQTIVHPSCSHLETNLPLACNKSFCFCFTWLPGCSRPSEPFPSKTCLHRPTFFARRPTTGLGVGYLWSDYPRYPRRATPSTVEPNLIVHPLTWVPTKTILRRARDMSSLLSV